MLADGLDQTLQALQHLRLGFEEPGGAVAAEVLGQRLGELVRVSVDLVRVPALLTTLWAWSPTAAGL